MNQTDTGSGNGQARSPRETTRQLDGEIAALREELAGLVAELDRRRHELLDLREAFSRMLAKPERVAAEQTVPTKIFIAAANAAVATAIKKVVERGLQVALKRNGKPVPPQLRPFPSRPPARMEALSDSGTPPLSRR